MLSSKKQVQYPNAVLNDVIIRNASNGMILHANSGESPVEEANTSLEINLIKKTTPTDPLSLYSLSFVEDMNEPHISGSMIVVDRSNIFDYLGILTNAEIEMDIWFYDTIDDQFNYKTTKKKLFFNIIDIETMSDPANQQISRDVGTANYINIRFSSKEFVHSDFVGHNIDYDRVLKSFHNFIGQISGNYNLQVSYSGESTNKIITNKPKDIKIVAKTNGKKDADDNPIVTLSTTDNVWPENSPTFFGNLINRYNEERRSKFSNRPPKGFKAHATYNEVWIKPEYFFYPTFKPSSVPRLTQLINYVKEYSCLFEDANFVDFMFWEDLDGFNFKSIAKMVLEAPAIADTPTYFPDINTQNMGAIVSMEVIKDIEPMDLISSGALTSEYIRIKPNWNSPYRNILGGEDQYTKELIKYNYKEDIFEYEGKSGLKRKNDVIITNKRLDTSTYGYSPFSKSELNITSNKGDFNSMAFRISEEIYGFYDSTSLNSKYSPWWAFMDKGSRGFTFGGGNTLFKADYNGDSEGLTYDFDHPARLEEEYWQAQYDFSELPAVPLYVIYNNIKWPLTQARQNYIEAKKLNEKWKFYFDNICCERKVPLNFFAILTKADKIYGGDPTGSTFQEDPGGIFAYSWAEVEFWPREDVDAILKTGDEIIKFENHESYPFVFVKPKGGLEGTMPITRQYKNKIEKYDIKGSENKKGATYKTKDTRAFNINEILNGVGITFFPEDAVGLAADLKENIKQCKFFITNPGLAFPVDQENSACKTSYPKGFGMMPIGTFRYANECDKWQTWNFGRIVQMHAIPREIMQTISKGEQGLTGISLGKNPKAPGLTVEPILKTGETSTKINFEHTIKSDSDRSKYLFVFDVVNAHDGLCDNTCGI